MADSVRHSLDSAQVKKAIQALFAYQKTKKANSLLLNEHDQVSLMVTVWKIPTRAQTIRIPLPHGIRPSTSEVCLFTKDEPNMNAEQTEKFYKKLLSQHGVTQITEVIPLKKLKKEYKPFEAKRRLLSNHDLFLSDDRIRRLLPSLIGKHFYKEKREPQSVNLKSKHLATELNRYIQGTQLHITNKGCCYTVRVGHTGMEVADIVENTLTVAQALAEKFPMKWKNIKVLHLKTQTSVALPVFNSSFDSLEELKMVKAMVKKPYKKKPKKKSAKDNKPVTAVTGDAHEAVANDGEESVTSPKQQNEDDEIPLLVPIEEPTSKKKDRKKKLGTIKSPAEKWKAGEKRKGFTESTPKPSAQKRKIIDSDKNESEIASKHKKELRVKPLRKETEENSAARRSILKKTPKKAPGKSILKLTKSAQKAPQTPKPKQKKKMNNPQSV
ncbi:ribosomal L1 domain-containing protein 1 isoform X2 [Pseudophryne corroboree]|uniref:ribosomal L1 domain-containing protein 1 isoform X2 n=1 Tax=Pseudophryne corroboree TaxID=495146 RepID=UPI0030813DC3